MNKNGLQTLSKNIKKEAGLLLKKTNLLDSLGRYGEVMIRGSYELDLMIDRDIDIYVICKKFKKQSAIDALLDLINENIFRGYTFYDFVKRRKKGFPKGYYLGLKTKFKNEKWKVDIWFLRVNDGVSNRFMKKILSQLNEQNRLKILELKYLVQKNNIDISSYLIYLAVVEGNVKTLSELKIYLKNHN